MVTKNAPAAQAVAKDQVTAYRQLDHHVLEVLEMTGTEVLLANQAWRDYAWTHQYFKQEPKEGYFIWIKEQPSCAFLSCITLDKANTKQQLSNLVVIEAGLDVDMSGSCETASLLTNSQNRSHQAQGKLVLRPGANLYYQHLHDWAKSDQISTNYDFILEEGASLDYIYKVSHAGQAMQLATNFYLTAKAKSDFKVLADCQDVKMSLHDTAYLQGQAAQAISTLRILGRANSQVTARSKIVAQAAAKGHLDCGALLLDPTTKVKLIPELEDEHPDAQLTHEASIGKLSAEQILYLRSRGFDSEQAEDLILRGFLSEQTPSIKGL